MYVRKIKNQVLPGEALLSSKWSIRGTRSTILNGLAMVSSIPAIMASFVCSGLAFALMAIIGSLLQTTLLLSSALLLPKLQLLLMELELLPLESRGLDLMLPSLLLLVKLHCLSHSRMRFAAVRPSMTGMTTSIKMQSIFSRVGLVTKSSAS